MIKAYTMEVVVDSNSAAEPGIDSDSAGSLCTDQVRFPSDTFSHAHACMHANIILSLHRVDAFKDLYLLGVQSSKVGNGSAFWVR